jgi:hypothetical protein
MALDFFKNSLKICGIFLFVQMAHSADDSFEAVAQHQQRLAEKPIQSFNTENQEQPTLKAEVKLEDAEEKGDPTKLAGDYRKIIQTQEEKPSEVKALTAIKLAALLIQQGIPLNEEDEVLLKREAERKDVINYQLILNLGILLKQKPKEANELYTTLIKRVITESNLDSTLILDIVAAFEKLNHFNHVAMLCRALITTKKENILNRLVIFSINRLAFLSMSQSISFDKKEQTLLQTLAEKGNINAMTNFACYLTTMQNFHQAEVWLMKALKLETRMTLDEANNIKFYLAIMAIRQDKPMSENIIEWLSREENAKIRCAVEIEKYERAKQKAKEDIKREKAARELLEQEPSRKKKEINNFTKRNDI